MSKTLEALGMALVYDDFRDDFFANPNEACAKKFLTLNDKEVEAMNRIVAEDGMKQAMADLGTEIRRAVGCPEPPCPWGGLSSVPWTS